MTIAARRAVPFGLTTPVRFDPNNISGGALSVDHSQFKMTDNTGTIIACKGQKAHKTGKWYYELVMATGLASSDTGGGLSDITGPLAGWDTGNCLVGCGMFLASNGFFAGGSNQGNASIGGPPTGPAGNTWMGIATDLNNNLNWFTFDGSTWSFGGNPATGTNGKAGGWTVGAAVVPICSMGGANNGMAIGIRTHTLDFVFSRPSGFAPWDEYDN